MKFNATVTRKCNLRCPYCYVARDNRDISPEIAEKAVDLAISLLPPGGLLDFGFFGGEPLLRFDLIQQMVAQLRARQQAEGFQLALGLTTNGTLLSPAMLEFMADEEVVLCISLDGPEDIFSLQRGNGSKEGHYATVVKNIELAAASLPSVKINAVYGPETLHRLPDSVRFLSGFGVPVELNLNVMTPWAKDNLSGIDDVFAEIAQFYLERYQAGSPIKLQPLADHIMTGILGGVDPACRCKLGVEELAVDVNGDLYPCERLIGRTGLTIGDVQNGIDPRKQELVVGEHLTPHPACVDCPIRTYCNHSCGCTNWFLTGNFGTAHHAVCSIEKALFKAMRGLLEPLQRVDGFAEHIVQTLNRGCHACPEEASNG